jgi:hypothetical protein
MAAEYLISSGITDRDRRKAYCDVSPDVPQAPMSSVPVGERDVKDEEEALAVNISGSQAIQVGGANQTNIWSYNYYSQQPVRPVVSSLPADTAAFTGRGEQIERMRAAAGAGRVVAIHAIDGMPGVGKTTLAVHVGHRVADQFPDRQLFVDLHAHTPGQRPADPADVLAMLLAADGMDPRYLAESLDGRAAMWRDRMASKRVLLILDNAASSAQVAPLLPGSAGCLVLVTSRRYLGDLPSALTPVPLDVLPPVEAEAMFISLAGRAGAERAEVAEMVTMCGYLPLAISLLASVFRRHQSWTMGYLIAETRAQAAHRHSGEPQ